MSGDVQSEPWELSEGLKGLSGELIGSLKWFGLYLSTDLLPEAFSKGGLGVGMFVRFGDK